MGTDETRIIHLPTYFKVLRTLPGVNDSDIEETKALFRRVLQSRYEPVHESEQLRLRRLLRGRNRVHIVRAGESIPERVLFHRGPEPGDGRIFIEHAYQAEDGASLPTQIVLNRSGVMSNSLIDFHRVLPQSLGKYFVGAVFGVNELPSAKMEAVDALLISGAEELYQCAAASGNSLEACQDSPGARKIAETKEKMAAAEREALARMEKEREAEARENARVEAEQRAKERDDHLESAEELWRSAEEMREEVDFVDILFNFGNPIQSAMDRYKEFRSYAGTADDLENARVRLQHAEWMMRDIGNGGGWPYFEERYCPGSYSVANKEDCGAGLDGTITTYQKSCDFGVTNTKTESNCQEDHFSFRRRICQEEPDNPSCPK